MKAWLRRSVPFLLLACSAAAISACDETLEGGLGCGVLCPERPSQLQQDTLLAVALDTTLIGFPPIGTEGILVLASRADTFDARAILRFDSLPTTFRRVNEVVDSTITDVDSAFLVLRLTDLDTLAPVFTIAAYDVETGEADDTTAAALVPLFSPERLLGSASFDPRELVDTVPIRVPLDSARLNAKIRGTEPRRLRVGLRLLTSSGTDVKIVSSNGAATPQVVFRPSLDTAVADISVTVFSKTPASSASAAADLADFQIVATPPAPVPPGVLRLGGIPGRRGYMRFDLPSRIVDSSVIVRAQLLLTQRPSPAAPAAADTGAVQAFALAVGGAVTDLERALYFLRSSFDSTRVVPADSGVRNFEVIQIVRGWRGTDPVRTPRALALRSTTEALSGWYVDFFSNEAPAEVRPRLVITYVPQPAPRVP